MSAVSDEISAVNPAIIWNFRLDGVGGAFQQQKDDDYWLYRISDAPLSRSLHTALFDAFGISVAL